MKEKKQWLQKIRKIDLVDRCIMLIMIILMIQTMINLFTHHEGQNNVIDIVIRTSSASIFGYIISANFIRHASSAPISPDESKQLPPQPDYSTSENVPLTNNPTFPNQIIVAESLTPTIQDKIDPINNMSSIELEEKNTLASFDQKTRPHDLQIIFVATIGMIALISLLIANNFETIDESLAGTVSQLRDFVSGSIGFLIGCSTHSIES